MTHQQNYRLATALIGLYFLWLALHLLSSLLQMNATLDYSEWGCSDMLINYQAGFVRRGLLGELLYRIYQIAPYNVGQVILSIIIISGLLFFALLYRTFRQLSYSSVLWFSCFTLQFMALAQVVGIRRDYLTLILAFLSYWSYRKWLAKKNGCFQWLLLCQIILILSTLLHEGSWFYIVPIIVLHFTCFSHIKLHLSWWQSICRGLAFSFPTIALMLFIYIYKGSTSVAQQIWDSWQPLFQQYPRGGSSIPSLGYSVDYLSCTMADHLTACFHSNWSLVYFGWLPMFPLTLLLFPAIIFLVTHANDSQLSWGYSLSPGNRTLLTSILMVQLMAMSPFFLFLSCDYGRLFCYWIVSTLFAYRIFYSDVECFPNFIQKISVNIQKRIDTLPFLCTPLGYALILVLTPCNMVGGAALGAIPLYRMIHETPSLLVSLIWG